MSTEVLYAEAGGVATITIDRPEVHNAFRLQTMHELVDAFDRADAAADVGVVVLTGTGERAFSTGGDVAMEDAFDPAEGRRTARLLMRLAEAIRGTGKPVIAKVRGWCVGGGNELVLMCDFVLAAESARFAHTDSKIGNSPIWWGTQLLPGLVGMRRAKEILLLGDVVPAPEAQRIGWINRAVGDDELDAVVDDWCARLLERSPQAMRLTKISLDFAGDLAMPSVRHGFETLTGNYGTDEFHEGTQAFLERRAPDSVSEVRVGYRSVFRPGLFDGRAVVVTGGGSGIGRCIAHELAALGAGVALVGRTAAKLEAVAGEIRDDGGSATTHTTDIRDEDGVRAVVEEIVEAHGRIDGLVNNAGGQYRAALADTSTKGFEAVVRTNLTGGFVVMREVHARWMAQHGGAIVNIVSDFWGGWPGFGHSAAARAGMATLTETAATEWAAAGVRVNSVAPGPVASSGLDTYDEADRETVRHIAREVPLQRFGTESEVSAAVVFLLSPAASFVTGACLRVDGGVPNTKPGWWELQTPERGERFDGFHRARTPDILEQQPDQ